MADTTTTLENLKNRVRQFSDERGWTRFDRGKDLAIGVVTEAAELLELFRFQPESQTEQLISNAEHRKRVEEELADVLFFLLRFAHHYNVDVSDAFERKLILNGERYPSRESHGHGDGSEGPIA